MLRGVKCETAAMTEVNVWGASGKMGYISCVGTERGGVGKLG